MSPFIAFAVVLITAFTVVWLLGTIWGHIDSAPRLVQALVIGVLIFLVLMSITGATHSVPAN
jgi:biotin transporter BioY